jgi:hypothetical protein
MKLWSRLLVAGAIPAAAWMVSSAHAQAPVGKGTTATTSDTAFKNVQVLKGIPLDDFMGTMGVMSAALGFDCSECHAGAGTDKVDWAADTPKKVIARKMVTMVQTINKENFNTRQLVTCWTCHHGKDRPATTPALEYVYGPPTSELDDVLRQEPGMPTGDSIVDKYLTAIGGAAKWGAIKSYVATGKSVGFGCFGGGGVVTIYAQFPDKHTTLIDFKDTPDRGDQIRSYNGTVGWLKTPLNVLGEYQLTGGELAGAKLDAELTFPSQVKQVLTGLRVSLPLTISDLPGPSSQTSTETGTGIGKDRLVDVVQGNGPDGLLATMFFDQQSHLLIRIIRYAKSPIGRVPTQVDYSDYRDVQGVKVPFHMTFAWLDGRDAIQLSDVKVNVPIPAARFGKPSGVKP